HYPQEDEDFMLSVFRSFAPDADDIRVTFTHFSELNLIMARRVYQALADAGLDRMQARELVEAAAKTSWRTGTDFREVLAGDADVTSRVPADRLDAIRAEVWQESTAN